MAKNRKEIVVGGLTAAAAVMTGAQVADAADVSDVGVDWSGFYMGLSAAMQTGDSPMRYDTDYVLGDDVSVGGFVGVNHQMGNLVVGIELALQSGVDADGNNNSIEPYKVDYTVDSKLKLGMDLGSGLLVSGFAGPSGGGFHNQNDDYAFFGVNYGLGAEYMVTEKFSLGAEVLGRSVIDTYGWTGYPDPDPSYQATLRAAFHF